MKVLVVTKDLFPVRNGLSDHTGLVCQLLARHGHQVTVLCEKLEGRPQGAAASQTVMEFAGRRELLKLLVQAAAGRHRPDVVLFQYVPHMWGRAGIAPFAALLPLWLLLRLRLPVVSFLHELHVDWSIRPKQLILALSHRLQLMLIGMASRSLIVTNYKRETSIGKWWGRKVHRLPAGNVSARKADRDRRRKYAWPYITWFGTLSADQRLEPFVQAFCRLAARDRELRLVLVGGFDVECPRMQGIYELAGQHGLRDRIVVCGYVEDDELSDILHGSAANLFINEDGPSGRRGVIAAYLRSGRAVISLKGGETDPEFVHGLNVYFVQDNDTEVLERQLRQVLQDQQLRGTLERGARRLYDRMFSDSSIYTKLHGIFKNTLLTERKNKASRRYL